MKYILGTGGFAREVYFLIEEMGLKKEFGGFLEPIHVWKPEFESKTIYGHKILHLEDFNSSKDEAIIGISDPYLRHKIVTEQLPADTHYPKLIHPNTNISKYVKIMEGAIITAGCVITVDITIGKQCQLNPYTTIGHDCIIGDYFTSTFAVNISGNCNIGNFVFLGTNSSIKQGVNICDNVTIGMGGVVVKDITEEGIYIGNPLKKLEKK